MTQAKSESMTRLFADFTESSYDEWLETTLASLKGASFEKKLLTPLVEGLTLQPIYRHEDSKDIAWRGSLPGQYPFVRGVKASGNVADAWQVAQALPLASPEDYNAALRHDLERGQNVIVLRLDLAGRSGKDPDQSVAGDVGRDGLSILRYEDLAAALEGIDLSAQPLHIQAGASAPALLALLVRLMQARGQDISTLQVRLGLDPLALLASRGSLPGSLEAAYDTMADLLHWSERNMPGLRVVGVDVSPYADAGASAVQELAAALATGTAYLRQMIARHVDINRAASDMHFTLGLSAQVFLEIAKLRAVKLLWAQVVRAFGGDTDAQRIRLHAVSTRYNKSAYDPYVNMLRTTVEGFAAAIGGVEGLSLHAFDVALRPPDEFSRRIARNQQFILQNEANLTRVIDPGGGSWYIESLTDALAREAWAAFQRIEAAGGMAAVLVQGSFQDEIAQVAAQRSAALASRREVQVGINRYPNAAESRLSDPSDYAALHASALAALGTPTQVPEVAEFSALLEAVDETQSLGRLSHAVLGKGHVAQVTPLIFTRGARLFEELRDRAAAYTAKQGQPPRIFLANMGPLAQHKARADFSQGFFEVGGFELISPSGFQSAAEAANAAIQSGAPAIVICSTDETYPEIVPALATAIKAHNPEAVLILAGYPEDQIQAHRDAGVDEFIHIRANCYELNAWLLERLGS